MKIGLSSGLTHTNPQHWAQQLKGLGCKSVTFPVNCNSDKDIIRAYADAANEAGLVIAEVGIWNNMLDQDPEKRKVALDYNIRQLILADEIGALCAVNVAGTPSIDFEFFLSKILKKLKIIFIFGKNFILFLNMVF